MSIDPASLRLTRHRAELARRYRLQKVVTELLNGRFEKTDAVGSGNDDGQAHLVLCVTLEDDWMCGIGVALSRRMAFFLRQEA